MIDRPLTDAPIGTRCLWVSSDQSSYVASRSVGPPRDTLVQANQVGGGVGAIPAATSSGAAATATDRCMRCTPGQDTPRDARGTRPDWRPPTRLRPGGLPGTLGTPPDLCSVGKPVGSSELLPSWLAARADTESHSFRQRPQGRPAGRAREGPKQAGAGPGTAWAGALKGGQAPEPLLEPAGLNASAW